MRAFTVTGRQPKSVQADRLDPWKGWVRVAYRRAFPTAPVRTDDLYALVYYLHRRHDPLDADNLSKPVLDALTGAAYQDDSQVKVRTAGVFDLRGGYRVLSLHEVPQPLQQHLVGALASNEPHTLYVEIGRLHYGAHFQFGAEVTPLTPCRSIPPSSAPTSATLPLSKS